MPAIGRDVQRSRGAESRALAGVGVPDEARLSVIHPLNVDIMAVVENLPIRQRQVCVLSYLMDQPDHSIAEGLGVTEGAVKTQLHRARYSLA
ncbi:MAG: RNA polymerase sigma factor [Microbacteriaceae bacterium]